MTSFFCFFFFLICTACLQAKAPLPSTPTSSSLWCHLRSWSPGCPHCPHAAPRIGEPTPLPPSAPPQADLSTLSIFLVLPLVTLSPSLHPSTSARSLPISRASFWASGGWEKAQSCQSQAHVGSNPTLPLLQDFACSVAKLCPTLCNPMDCSPQGSSVRAISQARILVTSFEPPWHQSLSLNSKPQNATRVVFLNNKIWRFHSRLIIPLFLQYASHPFYFLSWLAVPLGLTPRLWVLNMASRLFTPGSHQHCLESSPTSSVWLQLFVTSHWKPTPSSQACIGHPSQFPLKYLYLSLSSFLSHYGDISHLFLLLIRWFAP